MANKLLHIDDFYRTGGEWYGRYNYTPITSVVIDTRLCEIGSTFFALSGQHADGHDFIDSAIENGATIIVYSNKKYDKKFKAEENVQGIRTDDVISYLQRLANRIIKKFPHPILGITGSNGKTTTKEMISELLSHQFNVHKTHKNLNNHLGVPLTILELTPQHNFLVLEMGMNHSGEILDLCEIAHPTYGIITNIGSAHIEFFKNKDAIAKAKGELFDYLRETSGFLFINSDDPFILKQLHGKFNHSLFYGQTNKEATIRARDIKLHSDGTWSFQFLDTRNKMAGFIQLSIPGKHQINNAMAAVAVGIKFGIKPEIIGQTLSYFKPSNQRMEQKQIKNLVLINDCYNANPDSMMAGLQTLHQIQSEGRKIAILGDMYELGDWTEKLHQQVGEYINQQVKVDVVICVGIHTHKLFSTLTINKENEQFYFEEKENVETWLKENLRPTDVVYLKASRGMKLETIAQFIETSFS